MKGILTATPSDVCKRRIGCFFSAWIKPPWIRIDFRIKMHIAERIDNVGIRWNDFVVNVQLRTEIASHRSMRLGYAGRFAYDSVQYRYLIFPCFKRDRAQTEWEGGRWGFRTGGGRWIFVKEILDFSSRFGSPMLITPKECEKPGSWKAEQKEKEQKILPSEQKMVSRW